MHIIHSTNTSIKKLQFIEILTQVANKKKNTFQIEVPL